MNCLFVDLLAINMYCYLIKYKAKQNNVILFYVAIDELKMFYINNILKMDSKDELKEFDIKNCTRY